MRYPVVPGNLPRPKGPAKPSKDAFAKKHSMWHEEKPSKVCPFVLPDRGTN
jgi:hypothetical protein